MDFRDYLAVIRLESAALADAAVSVPLDTVAPACGWTVAELLAHIGRVQRWAARMVETRATERVPREAIEPPPADEQLAGWFRAATERLLAALDGTDPAAPVWTFTNERSTAFWARRQAHEVAVHRWDAQEAAGSPQDIETVLAADGVDEVFGILPFRFGERFAGNGETIHFCCTDAEGEWLARFGPAGLTVERVHARGDAAARGRSSDLDLFLWNRISAEKLEVFGDRALLEKFQALAAH